MRCVYCKYNDGLVYTSIPPKYRCTITNEFHLGSDDCNVEFAPVQYGKWVNGKCSICGEHAPFWMMASTYHESNYCPNCGAKMK